MKVLIRRSAGSRRQSFGVAAARRPPAVSLLDRVFSPSARFASLAGFLVATFVLGGGARGDIASLLLLRPLAVLVCGYALVTLDRSSLAAHRGLLAWFAAVVALVVVHLVPLPPAIWHALPGRSLLIAVDAATGNAGAWRPLTIVPDDAMNALFSLTIPAAVLLLGIQLPQRDRNRLVPWLLGLIVASGILGLLQAIGPERGPLYFYAITNPGQPVGLFSNRNHASLLLACLAPLAATWLLESPTDRRRMVIGLIATATLAPLAIAAGSRAGLVLTVVGLAGSLVLLWRGDLAHADRRFVTRAALGAGAILVAVSASLLIFSHAASVDRLLADNQGGDLRFRSWPVVLAVARDFFPWGSGAGSFATAFQIREPVALLKPTYFNHAHNDLLEVYATTGIPGMILLGVGVIAVGLAAWAAWRRDPAKSAANLRHARALARMASLILGLIAIASLVDYPLRTPSLAAFAMVMALWLRPAGDAADFDYQPELDNARPGRAIKPSVHKKVEHAAT